MIIAPATAPAVRQAATALGETVGQRLDVAVNRIVFLLGEEASAKAVQSRLTQIAEERQRDDVVVLILLGSLQREVHGSYSEAYFQLYGSSTDEPWTSLALRDAIGFPGGNVAVVVSDCVDSDPSGEPSVRQSRGVSLIAVCPFTTGNELTMVTIARALSKAIEEESGESELVRMDALAESVERALYDIAPPFKWAVRRRFAASDVPIAIRRRGDPLAPYLANIHNAQSVFDRVAAVDTLSSAALQLAERGIVTTQAGETLLQLARSRLEDSSVRYAAIKGLGRLRYTAAVPVLGGIVADTSIEVPVLRILALDTAVMIAPAEVVPLLEQALKDSSAPLRQAALRAVREVESEEMGRMVASVAIRDPNEDVRIAALQVMPALEVGRDHFLNTAKRLFLGVQKKPPATPAVRAEALTTWGLLGGNIADADVVRLIRKVSEDVSLRETAVLAQGRFFVESNRAAAEEALKLAGDRANPDSLRSAAIASWRRIGGPAAAEALLDALDDDESEVRLGAIAGAGELKLQAAVPKLIKIIDDAKSEERTVAVTALGRIGAPSATSTLFAAVRDDADVVRAAAVDALTAMRSALPPEQLVEQLGADSDRARRTAVDVTDDSNANEAVVDALVRLVGDEERNIRDAAAAKVGALTRFRAYSLQRLTERMAEGRPSERAAIAVALRGISGPEATRALASYKNDHSSIVRAEVIRGLAKTDPLGSVPHFIEAARDADETVRLVAAEALAAVMTPEALLELRRLAKDDSAAVRAVVGTALRNEQGRS